MTPRSLRQCVRNGLTVFCNPELKQTGGYLAMNETICLRDAQLNDADTIAAFNNAMAEETEGKSLDPQVIGPGVRSVLEDPALGRYWVAEIDARVVGQLMVTYEWSDWRNGLIWWVQSVYVAPDCRRRGVFSALYRHVESLAIAEPRVCGIRLYVERDNVRAHQTYGSMGMAETGYSVMETLFSKNRD